MCRKICKVQDFVRVVRVFVIGQNFCYISQLQFFNIFLVNIFAPSFGSKQTQLFSINSSLSCIVLNIIFFRLQTFSSISIFIITPA